MSSLLSVISSVAYHICMVENYFMSGLFGSVWFFGLFCFVSCDFLCVNVCGFLYVCLSLGVCVRVLLSVSVCVYIFCHVFSFSKFFFPQVIGAKNQLHSFHSI